jgi:glycogen debranching enzyme
MKSYLTFLITLTLNSIILSQYEDTGKRGVYFEKKKYIDESIHSYEDYKNDLPSPVLEDNPDYLTLYWKAWQLAFNHFKKPPVGSPFVSNYLDEAFAPNIFQWDTFFMIMFARYAHHIFSAVQSLDNFYCRQYENGYICREIVEATGEDFVFEGREHTVNPPLFSWAEVESYKVTGDKSRFKMVLPVLEKYAEWLETYRKKNNAKHNLYWQTGLGSGMDNTPRQGSGWIDISCQMVMMYSDLAKMCDEIISDLNPETDISYGQTLGTKRKSFKEKAEEISLLINKFMWNEEEGIYYDVDDDGTQIKHKTIASFWPLLANVADKEQADKLLSHLKDPKTFWRTVPFPSLSADHKNYKADGEYWLGSVWAPTNVMVIKGLDKFSRGYENSYWFGEFSVLASENYLDAIYKVYKKTGTIWENYSPESFSRGVWSRPDFVGWTGCGPIQLLIENILGFLPNGSEKKLAWNLNRIDNHGIKNLRFGDITASLICEKRMDINSECVISVESDKSFELTVIKNFKDEKVFQIKEGRNNLIF